MAAALELPPDELPPAQVAAADAPGNENRNAPQANAGAGPVAAQDRLLEQLDNFDDLPEAEQAQLRQSAIANRYYRVSKLGRGAYGVVYKARDLNKGDWVALKRVLLQTRAGQGVSPTVLREVALLRQLRHPNILSMRDEVAIENRCLYMACELLNMDLKGYIDAVRQLGNPMTDLLIKSYVYQLLDGLAYCHAHQVIHRDLKPQNLLIDREGALKISDFGLAREFTVPHLLYTFDVVTPWYRAPELLLGGEYYGTAIDIWSVGCIFAEMVRIRSALFEARALVHQLFRMFMILGTPDEDVWPGVTEYRYWMPKCPKWHPVPLKTVFPNLCDDGIDLLSKMFRWNPNDRISAADALLHPYFDDFLEAINRSRRTKKSRKHRAAPGAGPPHA